MIKAGAVHKIGQQQQKQPRQLPGPTSRNVCHQPTPKGHARGPSGLTGDRNYICHRSLGLRLAYSTGLVTVNGILVKTAKVPPGSPIHSNQSRKGSKEPSSLPFQTSRQGDDAEEVSTDA